MTSDPRPLSGATEKDFYLHIVTAMSRTEFLEPIKRQLMAWPIVWHPIVASDFVFPEGFRTLCIEPRTFDAPPGAIEPTYHKLNDFISNCLRDNAFYCFLNDDDLYAPNWFDAVLGAYRRTDKSGDIMMCSQHRGDCIPPGARIQTHAPAIAHPSNMRIGDVGMEQIIVRGSILKNYRFPDDRSGDGMLIEQVFRDYGDAIEYVPQALMLFNYFEKGRYSQALKSLIFQDQEPP